MAGLPVFHERGKPFTMAIDALANIKSQFIFEVGFPGATVSHVAHVMPPRIGEKPKPG